MPTVSRMIEDCSVKTLEIVQITMFAISMERSGLRPRPRLLITRPPTMNPVLRKPHSRPHISTDTSERP